MTKEQQKKCHTIIHASSVLCGAVGAGLAQLPMADAVPISAVQIAMIVALGKVFDRSIEEGAAKGMLMSQLATMTGRAVSSTLVGWIPVLGNLINAGTASGITETIGWAIAKDLDGSDEDAKKEKTVRRVFETIASMKK